jgi:hypothetical protein
MRDQNLEPLNDALSREIEQALAVEPSPEFHARVRRVSPGRLPLQECGGDGDWLVLVASQCSSSCGWRSTDGTKGQVRSGIESRPAPPPSWPRRRRSGRRFARITIGANPRRKPSADCAARSDAGQIAPAT